MRFTAIRYIVAQARQFDRMAQARPLQWLLIRLPKRLSALRRPERVLKVERHPVAALNRSRS